MPSREFREIARAEGERARVHFFPLHLARQMYACLYETIQLRSYMRTAAACRRRCASLISSV
eukprot:6200638-Pleurochrysis_carterae.AAC.1